MQPCSGLAPSALPTSSASPSGQSIARGSRTGEPICSAGGSRTRRILSSIRSTSVSPSSGGVDTQSISSRLASTDKSVASSRGGPTPRQRQSMPSSSPHRRAAMVLPAGSPHPSSSRSADSSAGDGHSRRTAVARPHPHDGGQAHQAAQSPLHSSSDRDERVFRIPSLESGYPSDVWSAVDTRCCSQALIRHIVPGLPSDADSK